jgi:hypothetical protein
MNDLLPKAALTGHGEQILRLGVRRRHAGAKCGGPVEPFAARSSRACAVSRAPRWGGAKWRAKWLAPWRAEWLREWRAGANAKGARERMRRPRPGSPAELVDRASIGGVMLGPWSARGGCASKAEGRAKRRAEWRPRAATNGAKGRAKGHGAQRERARGWALIRRARGASAAPFSRRGC